MSVEQSSTTMTSNCSYSDRPRASRHRGRCLLPLCTGTITEMRGPASSDSRSVVLLFICVCKASMFNRASSCVPGHIADEFAVGPGNVEHGCQRQGAHKSYPVSFRIKYLLQLSQKKHK